MKEDQRKGKIQTEKQRRRNSPVTVLINSIKNTSACQQTNTAVRDVRHPRTHCLPSSLQLGYSSANNMIVSFTRHKPRSNIQLCPPTACIGIISG